MDDENAIPPVYDPKRRLFLKKGLLLGATGSLMGLKLMSGCSEANGDEISPPEDLMREHGVLRRVLLVYDHCRQLLVNGEAFELSSLADAANIIRTFVEDYHEKLEEEVLFPQFTKRNEMVPLVQILSIQHQAGRHLTEEILRLANAGSVPEESTRNGLIKCLSEFNRMYRPHAAHEDTVLFPALRGLVDEKEFFKMGEDFEDKETELLGAGGFETMVGRVDEIEKRLGIEDLSQFVPEV